jgi:hypothetical protein
MKTFCDLLATDLTIKIEIELRPEFELSPPRVTVMVNQHQETFVLARPRHMQFELLLLDSIDLVVQVESTDQIDPRRGVEISRLDIDHKALMPHHCRLAELSDNLVQYAPTNHIVQHGQWRFRIDRPFYQWYHDISGQGWLLKP